MNMSEDNKNTSSVEMWRIIFVALSVFTTILVTEHNHERMSQKIVSVANTPQYALPIAPCLSDEQWVAQTLMILTEPQDVPTIVELGKSARVGGIVLVADFNSVAAQTLIDIYDRAAVPLIIASDEEGGRVQRLRSAVNPLPSTRELARLPVKEVEEIIFSYGQSIKKFGVDVVFAPVVDVGAGSGIGDRSFSDDPAVVAAYGASIARGYQRAGILPVYKHFPGHGTASIDSHIRLPTTVPFADLLGRDLAAYDRLLLENDDKVGVMVGHLSVPGLSSEPTSLSTNTVQRLLRGQDGGFQDKSYDFDGLVFSDAMNMGAISLNYSAPQATILSLVAGVDVVLVSGPNQIGSVIQEILISIDANDLTWERIDESVDRILRHKGVNYRRCSQSAR